MMAMKTKKRKPVTTYNRRGWWPDGWSVEKVNGRWVVMNKDTSEILHCCEADESEIDATIWADTNHRGHHCYDQEK